MLWGWGCTYSNILGFFTLALRSSFIWFFFCFSCIGSTLSKNNCSNWEYLSYFYLIIRFLSPYQNIYFMKPQVPLQFLWEAGYAQYKQYSQSHVRSFRIIRKFNIKIQYIIRSENINSSYPDVRKKLPNTTQITIANCCAIVFWRIASFKWDNTICECNTGFRCVYYTLYH